MIQHTVGMGVMEAIYARRTVRTYTGAVLDRKAVSILLSAAVQAPTAMHEEPWVFTVIQDKEMLLQLSDASKEAYRREALDAPPKHAPGEHHNMGDPETDIFHGAGTLVVIWAKPMGLFAAADCWLAAENLMLAACEMGLGSCVIGFCVNVLNSEMWKAALGIPSDWSAIAPIILGVPAGLTPPVPRRPVEIASWHEGQAS